jgi:hypothetical protein
MQPFESGTSAEWTAEDLNRDPSWVFELDERTRRDLTECVSRLRDPDRPVLEYDSAEFDLGSALPVLKAAFNEAKRGRGIALVRGLPRPELSAEQFKLLTWAIGLHIGVPRPQGKQTHYLSAVRDAGTVYRTGRGRGYSSNAELDFHTDSADLVALTCFNQARSGGMSMVTSSVSAYARLRGTRPDLAELLHQPFWFSRQEEQAPDESAAYPNPIFDVSGGLLFSKWNRNRLLSAQRIEGVPRLSAEHHAAIDLLDDTLRQPDLMYAMYLRPGDMQILNSHVTLHSRTEFEDHDEPERKRLLYRLWLAPPDSSRLPESWKPAYRAIAAGSVRGGIIGQAHDEHCREFERRQAAGLGMSIGTGQ